MRDGEKVPQQLKSKIWSIIKLWRFWGFLTKCTESRQTHIRGEDRDINNKHTYTLAIVRTIDIDT